MKKVKSKKTSAMLSMLGILLILYSISMLCIIVWSFLASLKTYPQFKEDPLGIPSGWPWEWEWMNYIKAFQSDFVVKVGIGMNRKNVYLERMFLYSLLYAGGCSFVATLVPCLTAYTTAKFSFKFSKIIYTTVVVVMALPIVGSLPAEIRMATALHIRGEIWGVWILKANFLGMYYFVFYAFFQGISKEYYEAAYIDGAGEFRVLWSIMLPIVRNQFFTVMLIKFIEFWNDYQTPLIYTPDYPPISYGLYLFSFSNDQSVSWPTSKMTGAMLTMLPILIVFLIFRNKIIGNVTMGGVKE